MLIKAGVDISRLHLVVRRALVDIAKCVEGCGEELVVTSTYEGNHSPGSLHYANLAVDVRYPSNRTKFVNCLRDRLGPDFDIVAEKDHVHIEYDPKLN